MGAQRGHIRRKICQSKQNDGPGHKPLVINKQQIPYVLKIIYEMKSCAEIASKKKGKGQNLKKTLLKNYNSVKG